MRIFLFFDHFKNSNDIFISKIDRTGQYLLLFTVQIIVFHLIKTTFSYHITRSLLISRVYKSIQDILLHMQQIVTIFFFFSSRRNIYFWINNTTIKLLYTSDSIDLVWCIWRLHSINCPLK